MSVHKQPVGLSFLDRMGLWTDTLQMHFSETHGPTVMKRVINRAQFEGHKDPVTFVKVLEKIVGITQPKTIQPKCPEDIKKIETDALSALQKLSFVLEDYGYGCEAVILSGRVHQILHPTLP